MKLGTLICKVSKEMYYLRSYQNTKQQKIVSSITQHPPWRRWYCISTTDVNHCSDTHGNRPQQYPTNIAERVKVISIDMIKPSSPTSINNKTVYFSLIDQMSPSVYNSIVLFYKNDPNNNCHSFNTMEKRTKLLKQSLSEILVDFYPFAGRIRRNELIECNDEGVEFCEADISDRSLTEFIENPSVVDVEALLPFRGSEPRMHTNVVLRVQANHFGCGGMALGVCLSHKITDGISLIDFLNSWSIKARDSNRIISSPNFNGASHFPPLKEFNDIIPTFPVYKDRVGVRRLIFDRKTINEMKQIEASTCANENKVHRPTTNEVVAAFIWKHLPKISYVVQFVNLRTRMEPPIPLNSVGNYIHHAIACLSSTSSSLSSSSIIDELRSSTKKINNNYIQNLMFNDESLTKLKKQFYEGYAMNESILCLSNISKFSVYETDFGMGKPVWACFPGFTVQNFTLVTSTPCGEGVEVSICMLEDDIAMLDQSLSHLPSPIVKRVSVK